MGFFQSLSKVVSKASGIGDPVSHALRKQGGTLGAIGGIMNPGATAADQFAGGAPINARNMLMPGLTPTPGATPDSMYSPYKPQFGVGAANPLSREQQLAQALQQHAGQFPTGNPPPMQAPGMTPQAPPSPQTPMMPSPGGGMTPHVMPFPMPGMPPTGQAQQPPIQMPGMQPPPRMGIGPQQYATALRR